MSKITSYSTDYQTFPALFELEPVAGKKVTADFSAPELSSLGGLPLVREYEKSSNRIIERIESCIKDPRREPMVVHSQTEMLRQRIYQIMAGFEDADDCDRLCRDGILKMCARRSASDGIDLASQPTMTRLENRRSRKELFDIGEAFIDDFIASYNSEPDSIIIDADDTNADTYGAQRKAHPSHPQTGSGQQGNQHFRPARTIDNQAPQEVETHSDNSTGRLPFLLPRLHGLGDRATGWHPLHYGTCREREAPEDNRTLA